MRVVVIAMLAIILASASALAFVQCNFNPGTPGNPSCVLGMSAMSNAHASTCGVGSYAGFLQCNTQVPGCALNCRLDTLPCAANELNLITLSATTNAHVSQTGYPQNNCCAFVNASGASCGTLNSSTVQILNVGSNNGCPAANPIEILRLSALSNAHVEKNTSALNSQLFPFAICAQLVTECNDGRDNDGDGFVDRNGIPGVALGDPGCWGPYDNDEHGTNQCDDGIDNDNDGFVDYRVNGGDPGCLNVNDDDERDTSVLQVCEADCTYVTDTICHADCAGRNGCLVVAPQCDARQAGTFIPISATTFGACCSGATQPAVNGQLTYATDRDRVRATRVQQTTSGASVIINVVSFK